MLGQGRGVPFPENECGQADDYAVLGTKRQAASYQSVYRPFASCPVFSAFLLGRGFLQLAGTRPPLPPDLLHPDPDPDVRRLISHLSFFSVGVRIFAHAEIFGFGIGVTRILSKRSTTAIVIFAPASPEIRVFFSVFFCCGVARNPPDL